MSAIPAVLTALTTVWTSSVTGFTVVKGPIYDASGSKLLAVGWDRSDQPSVIASLTDETIDLSTGLETVTVSSLLTVFVGNAGFDAAITSLFTAFGQARAAVIADPSLGRACNDASVGTDYEFTPVITETGDELVDLRFTVTANAYV